MAINKISKKTALQWRRFMTSEDGVKGLLWLKDMEPVIPKGESHEIVFDAGVVSGYGKVFTRIEELIEAAEKDESPVENSPELRT